MFAYRAIDILRDEMADPPGLTALAHRVGTNQARLGRAFQTHLGMSTFEYLREQSLVRAQELLATTDRQVQQIADAIGFRRAGDFATALPPGFGCQHWFTADGQRQRISNGKASPPHQQSWLAKQIV